jgi:hypothetical protein
VAARRGCRPLASFSPCACRPARSSSTASGAASSSAQARQGAAGIQAARRERSATVHRPVQLLQQARRLAQGRVVGVDHHAVEEGIDRARASRCRLAV